MKIKIQDNQDILEISDDQLDNDAFVDFSIYRDETCAGINATFPLNEVMAALIAFDAKRSRRLSEENHKE